jgi:RNA polymerase sigma factor (sigma-70 family)
MIIEHEWNWIPETDEIEEQSPGGAVFGAKQKPSAKFRGAVHAAFSGRKAQKLLSCDEEAKLVAAWQKSRDQDARARLIDSHLPLVIRAARARFDRGDVVNVDLLDLVHEGVVGLADAVDRFDPTKEARLSTFAKYYITGAILDLVKRHRKPFRTGTSHFEKRATSRLHDARRKFHKETGRFPSDQTQDVARMAELAETSPAGMKRAMNVATAQIIPLQRIEVVDPREMPEDAVARASMADRVRAAIEEVAEILSARDADILRTVTTFAPDDVEEISVGDKMHVLAGKWELTVERIRQIRRHSIALVRDQLSVKGMDFNAEVA